MDDHKDLNSVVKVILPPSAEGAHEKRTRSGDVMYSTEVRAPAAPAPIGTDLTAPPDENTTVIRVITKNPAVDGEKHLKRERIGNVIFETVEASAPR